MFITNEALAQAQLEVSLDEHGLAINGREAMPVEARRNCSKIAKQLAYTPQESDELVSYVANVTVWRVLKGITSI